MLYYKRYLVNICSLPGFAIFHIDVSPLHLLLLCQRGWGVDQDVVPSIPPPVTVLGGMFHHVGKEVRIDAKGNMIIQPTFLEKSFVSGNSRIGPHKCAALLSTWGDWVEFCQNNKYCQSKH